MERPPPTPPSPPSSPPSSSSSPESPPPVDFALLVRYAAGECGIEDARRVEEWLRADPAHAERLEALRRGSLPAEAAGYRFDVDAAWAKSPAARPQLVRAEAPAAGHVATPRRPRSGLRYRASQPSRAVPRIMAAAAALILAAVIVTRPGHFGLYGPPPEPPTITTAANELRRIELPDGTHVVLAPSSALALIATPEHGKRELGVKGSAYFEVVHSKYPFIVHAKGAVLEDLGTSFVVQAYPGDPSLHVAVRSGQLAVSRPAEHRWIGSSKEANRIVLNQAQVARIDTSGTVSVKSDPEIDDYFAWVSGNNDLRLHDSPLPDVLAALGRRFNVDFVVGDSILNAQRLTIALQQESLPEVLHILDEVLPARHTLAGGTHVTLYARDPNDPLFAPLPRAPR
jgi:transmembrane sensor